MQRTSERQRRAMGFSAYERVNGVDRVVIPTPAIDGNEYGLEDIELYGQAGQDGSMNPILKVLGNLAVVTTSFIVQSDDTSKKRKGPRLRLLNGKNGGQGVLGLALGAAALALNKPSGAGSNPSSGNFELPVFRTDRGYVPGEVVQWQDASLQVGVYVAYGYNAPGVSPGTVGSKYTKLAAFPFTASAWDAAATYSPGQVVSYKGGLWVCILISLNNVPDVSASFWAPMGLATFAAWFSPDGEALQRDPAYRQPLRQSSTLGTDPPPIVSTAVSTAYDSIDVAPGAATGGGAATAQVLSSPETASVGEQIRWQNFGIKVVCAGAGTGTGALVAITVPYSGAFLRAPAVRIVPRNLTAAIKALYPGWSADNKTLTIYAGVDPGAAGDLRFDVILSPQN